MKLLSLTKATALLGLDLKTLKRAVLSGQCPAVKVGDRWRIQEAALLRWASGTGTSATDHQ